MSVPKKKKRARSDEAKEQRKGVILVAARRLFETKSYDALTVAHVARQSRLAKGTVYLYFQSKEAIFFELLLSELEEWLGWLAKPLTQIRAGDVNAVAELFATSLSERPTLRRLFTLLHPTLEHNVDAESVRSFKLRGATLMQPTARELERSVPALGPGDGMRLLVHMEALAIGVGLMADPSESVKAVLAEPGLSVFRVDFLKLLRELLQLVMLGWGERHERSRA